MGEDEGTGERRDKLRKPPADRSVCPLWFCPRPLRPCCGCHWPGWPQTQGHFQVTTTSAPATLQQPDIRRHLHIFSSRPANKYSCAPAQRGRIFLNDVEAFCLHRVEHAVQGSGGESRSGTAQVSTPQRPLSWPLVTLLSVTQRSLNIFSCVECKQQQQSQAPPAEHPYKGRGEERESRRAREAETYYQSEHNDGIHISGREGLPTTSN